MKELGLSIKKMRIKQGLTQLELSKLLGMHQSVISSIENGKSNPCFCSIIKIAKKLNCSVSVVFKDIKDIKNN